MGKIITYHLLAHTMAKTKGMKMQPAVTDLYFQADTAGLANSRVYIDTARELSKVNRRLYSQSRMYGFQGLTFIWRSAVAATDLATIEVNVRTAGNTWAVQNAHTKGHALWNQMQDLVLEDNPSIAGKWHDFKVRLTKLQLLPQTLDALDGNGIPYLPGEWSDSTFVMPQHSVDGAGNPLPAEEFAACLVGADGTSIKSLTQAYQESRATVQNVAPNVPAGFGTSFFNLLTDSGSQEPELADVIEDENDQPPYDTLNYPGASANANTTVTVQYGAISATEVDGRVGGFVAPCGLLEIEINGFDSDGEAVALAAMPVIDLLLHVAPGSYKGVASIPMGQ